MKYVLFTFVVTFLPLSFSSAESCRVRDSKGNCLEGFDPNCPPDSNGQPGSCVSNYNGDFLTQTSDQKQLQQADRLDKDVNGQPGSAPSGSGSLIGQ